jgi:hypothetical protein
MRRVIEVQAPRPASSRAYGSSPVFIPPADQGSSASSLWGPAHGEYMRCILNVYNGVGRGVQHQQGSVNLPDGFIHLVFVQVIQELFLDAEFSSLNKYFSFSVCFDLCP